MTNETPKHYKFKIEPLTFIAENNLSFIVGNIIKYVCRYDKKDGVKDLLKAKDYLEKLIEAETIKSNLQKTQNTNPKPNQVDMHGIQCKGIKK